MVTNEDTAVADPPKLKTNQYSTFTFNLKPEKAKVRHDTMYGRDHLVVPCVMMTEGVHDGSHGPLFYPEAEMSKDPGVWNSKPVVVYHPEQNGQGVSACDPDVLNTYGVGNLYHTRWEGGGWKTECWLEEDKTKEVDDRVLNAINEGAMMEVSTGLFTDIEEAEGEWNGEKYVGIARNYRPDHLAILPDKKGACSIEDGAGLLRNEDGRETIFHLAFNEMSHQDVRDKLSEKIRTEDDREKGVYAWVMEVWDDYFIYEKGDKLYYQKYEADEANNEVKLVGVRQEAKKKVTYELVDGTIVGNAKMKTEAGLKYPASAYAYVPDRNKPSTWKLRLWETPAKKETAAQVGRAIAAIGKGFRGQKVQLPAAAVKKVKAKIRVAWKRTNPDKKASEMPSVLRNQEKGGMRMEREEIVDGLIANDKSPFTEEDREMLIGLSDEKFDWVVANKEEKPAKDPVDNDKDKGGDPDPEPIVDPIVNDDEPTAEQFIDNAPEGIRDMLQSGLAAHKAEKAAVIAKIVANERNPFSKEELEAKKLGELKNLATLGGEKKEGKPSYAGQGEVTQVGNEGEDEEPLVAPTINFEKKDK